MTASKLGQEARAVDGGGARPWVVGAPQRQVRGSKLVDPPVRDEELLSVLAQTRGPQVGQHPVQVGGVLEGLAIGKPVEREVFLDAEDLSQR